MKIHLIGVGGSAMGNLAAMLKSIGHEVTGSDTKLYPPMSTRLIEWGVDARPFHKDNLKGVELCIIGNVISRGNVEAEHVLNHRIPYMSMPEALFSFFLKGKDVIVVAGTHGKTTTTFLLDHILTVADQPPGLFAGGLRADGMNGFRVSDSPYFVIEGDEYDSAFFDKSAKFLHYRPRYLILTAVEYDHADIYESVYEYRRSFKRLLRFVPAHGLVAACISDKGVKSVLKDYKDAPVIQYSARNHKKLNPKKEKKSINKTKKFSRDGHTVTFQGYPGLVNDFSLIGNHNTANASAALLIAQKIGLGAQKVKEALQSFPGVVRRQQIRKTITSPKKPNKQIIFMEDFAHHPTAVAGTIQAVKDAWPGYKIHALYEPRSATSHKNIFQKEYVEAFKKADFIYLPDVFNKQKVPAKERLDVIGLVDSLNQKKNTKAFYAKKPKNLLNKLKKNFCASPSGDIILAMSNGAFGYIYPEIEKWLHNDLV